MFKTSLGYTVTLRPAWVTELGPFLFLSKKGKRDLLLLLLLLFCFLRAGNMVE